MFLVPHTSPTRHLDPFNLYSTHGCDQQTVRHTQTTLHLRPRLHNAISERFNYLHYNENKISGQGFSYIIQIVTVFIRFLCEHFSFYYILVFWSTIILILVFLK